MNIEELESLKEYSRILSEKNTKSVCNLTLVKYANRISLTKETMIDILKSENSGHRIFHHGFEKNIIEEAYAPFLMVMKELLKGKKLKPFFNKVGVYPLHERIFESYFMKGLCERIEEPFFSEIEFEKNKFQETLVRMLKVLSAEQPFIIVMDEISYAGTSTFELLERLLSEEGTSNIGILIFYNENSKVHILEEKYKDRFIAHCEKMNAVYDWPVDSVVEEIETESNLIFNPEDVDNYLNKTYNMYCMFAYDEMRYYLDFIYQKVQIENLGIPLNSEIRLCVQLCILGVYQGDCAHSLLVAENLARLSEETDDWRIVYQYYYIIAFVNMHNGNINDACEASEACINLAKEHKEERMEFNAQIAKIMSHFSGFHNILISYENYPVEQKLIEQCEKYKHYNHLAHIYVFCMENDLIRNKSVEEVESELVYFNKGIALGEKLGNEKFLMDAYRAVIMIASYSGNQNIVKYFYQKDIKVARRSGDRFEEAMIYNGLGYTYCTEGNYLESDKNFNNAMVIFHELAHSDYIIETFYNMATNAIMAHEYDMATMYLEKTIYLLDLNRKNSLRVCNISKVMGMIALSTFHQGQFHSSRKYVMKAGQFLDKEIRGDDEGYNYLWDDDVVLYFICKALLCTYTGHYEDAMELYRRAEVRMNRSYGNYFFAYPQFCIAKQYTLYLLGRMDERKELLDSYKRFCEKNGYSRHLEMIEKFNAGNYICKSCEAPVINCAIMDEVCEEEKRRYIEREALARRKEIQFFALFQNLLDRKEDNIDERMKKVLSSLASNYNLDGIMSIHLTGEGYTVYQENSNELSAEGIAEVVEFFENQRDGFVVSRYNGSYKDYKRLASVVFGEDVFSMVGVPIFSNEKLAAVLVAYTKSCENWSATTDRYVFNDYDYEIYTYLFRQIINAIKKWQDNEKIEQMNELLLKKAVTDELTGLHNRQGYSEIVNDILTDPDKRSQKYAFMYMDLDHFKHYNDTFGHHVGDAILIAFADIFRHKAPEGIDVIRFGGDEFGMIIPYEDKSVIISIAKEILAEIEASNGFEETVKLFALKAVNLEKEHYAGCSIGIAYMEDMTDEEDFEIARQNADSALYEVKKNGRNNYKEYEG